MPKASIDQETVRALVQSSPPSILAILQRYEMEVMRKLQPGALHPEDARELAQSMPSGEIFQAVRDRVWKRVPLPAAFPQLLRSLTEALSGCPQSDIGVVTECGADIETVRAWLREKLDELSIRFEQRSWCDGEASIEIIAFPDIPPELGDLLRREKHTST